MSELVMTILQRAHHDSAYVRPPRTIWLPHLPFSLPLGFPGDEVTQRRLVVAALEMLSSCRVPGSVRRDPSQLSPTP